MATTPTPLRFNLKSLHIAQRPSSKNHGPQMFARPVIEDNDAGAAVVTANGVVSGSVSVTTYWRRWLFAVPGAGSALTYTYGSEDENKAVTYVEDHLDSLGRLTRVSSEPLFVQSGVGRPIDGGDSPGGGGGGGSADPQTDFDFTGGVEPPAADVSNPEQFTTDVSYQPGIVSTAPKIGFLTGWQNLSGAPSLTENYAVAPDGQQTATRLVVPAGNINVGLRYPISGRTPGQHTNHIWVKSNTGGDHNFFFRSLADSNYAELTATPNWQRFYTIGNLVTDWFSLDVAATENALDVSVWGMDFFVGDQSARTATGGASYLNMLAGQTVDLSVPAGTYDAVITLDTGLTERVSDVVIASGVDYRITGPKKIRRVQFVAPGSGTGGGGGGGAGGGDLWEGDNTAPPPGIQTAGPPIHGTCTAWVEVHRGSGFIVNDHWNVNNWGLSGTIQQCVYIGDAVDESNSFRITSYVPRGTPWPGGGNPNTEVKSYPHCQWGQPPGWVSQGHTNLPIRVGDINVLWAGFKGLDSSNTSGHGHLSHDMRLTTTAEARTPYSEGAKIIRQELFVVVEQYEGYGAHPNGRAGSRYHGQYTIGGREWHVYIQPGASTDPNGAPNPQLIWLPVQFPLPNPLDMAPLFRWAMRTKHTDLKVNAPGLVHYGRTANDTLIDPDLFFTNNAMGVEVDEGNFDITVDTAYFRVNRDPYVPAGSETHTFLNSRFTNDKRPVMNNPLIINQQSQLAAYDATYQELPPGASVPITPAGDIYRIQPGPGTDVILDCRELGLFTKPVHILECRHVYVIGFDFEAATPVGGGVGQLSNQDEQGALIVNANLHPRLVGSAPLTISASGTILIEGPKIDMKGHNGDCIIINSNQNSTAAADNANLRIYVINYNFSGYVGHMANYVDGGPGGGPLGDSPHADFIHLQNVNSYAELIAENGEIYSGQEGLVAPAYGIQPERGVVSRLRAAIDERYIDPNPAHHQYIAPLSFNPRKMLLEHCWLYKSSLWNGSQLVENENHLLHWPPGSQSPMYFTAGDTGYGNAGDGSNTVPVASGAELTIPPWVPEPYSPTGAFTSVVLHSGMHTWSGKGTPPANTDYAPAANVGRNYRKGETLY